MDDASQLFPSFPLVPFPSPARRHVPHVFLCFACQTAYPVPRRWVIKRTPIIQLPYRRASSRSEPGHFFKLFFISYFSGFGLCFALLRCAAGHQARHKDRRRTIIINARERYTAIIPRSQPESWFAFSIRNHPPDALSWVPFLISLFPFSIPWTFLSQGNLGEPPTHSSPRYPVLHSRWFDCHARRQCPISSHRQVSTTSKRRRRVTYAKGVGGGKRGCVYCMCVLVR